jgi:serine/threonine-protein kinase ULK4
MDETSLIQTPGSQRPGEGYQTPVAKVKTVALEQLFTHNSDNIVKPIIGSKEIEKLGETLFNKEQLPFETLSLEEVAQNIENASVEKHLETIFNILSTSADKLNVLNYFESIVQHSNVANRLINSQFINLLIKLLK